ncbi:MAG TPA: hypothetical protein VF649_02910 [Sphingomonas sp.]|jgi:YVTN family beta-propeller protein|uniref:hypothetical protein n=1 Tax=Sphingomonas sp. TaxID=28214 RepID=UPI002ED82DEE
MRRARLAAMLAVTALAGCAKPAPDAVATSPAYLVYATNERSGDVSVIDPDQRKEIGRIAIGKRPRGLVASPDGRFLYVAVSGSPAAGPGVDESKLPPADKAADGIVVIDLATRKLLRTLRGISDPEQVAISADGEQLYVASEDTGELVVLKRQGGIAGRLRVGGEPEGIGLSPDGAVVLATSEEDHSVAIVRGTPPAVIGRIEVGQRPRNVAFLDQNRAIVPGEFDASLSLVDVANARRVRTITLAKADRPMGVARLDAHTALVTTGRSGRLVRVDVDAQRPETGSVDVGPRPWGLTIAPDHALAFTANGPSNDIAIVDPATMTLVGKVKVGDGPWGVLAVATPR